jgi:subtilase family serine protease
MALLFSTVAFGQGSTSPKPELITESVNNDQRIALTGNTRPEANAANDRGIVKDSMPMEHLTLQLKRPAELQKALDQYTEDSQNKTSPNYRKWLTAEEFGERFGLADSDIKKLTTWLESQGFTVNIVYVNKVVIDFSGTAGHVKRAFGTEVHNLDVNGVHHIANMRDPQIPSALAPAVAGISGLHDFAPGQ